MPNAIINEIAINQIALRRPNRWQDPVFNYLWNKINFVSGLFRISKGTRSLKNMNHTLGQPYRPKYGEISHSQLRGLVVKAFACEA